MSNLQIPTSRKDANKADEWVGATAPAPAAATEAAVKPKKLSLEFPPEVHRATKAGAAMRGSTMIAEILEMCRARNGIGRWPADIVESVRRQIAEDDAAAAAEEPRTGAPARRRTGRKSA